MTGLVIAAKGALCFLVLPDDRRAVRLLVMSLDERGHARDLAALDVAAQHRGQAFQAGRRETAAPIVFNPAHIRPDLRDSIAR